MYICPHDLIDKDGSETGHAMKAYNQEPEPCYSCVKVCPQQAIECRHYADVVPLGAQVQPLRGIDWHVDHQIIKTIQISYPHDPGRFSDPYGGKPEADSSDLTNHNRLFTDATNEPVFGQLAL